MTRVRLMSSARASPDKNLRLLGSFECQVVAAIEQLGSTAAYGSAIRKFITNKTGREVAIGAVYVTLERLEKKGFVSSELTGALPVKGGRAKRVFHLEAPGMRALHQTTAVLNAIGASTKEHPNGKDIEAYSGGMPSPTIS